MRSLLGSIAVLCGMAAAPTWAEHANRFSAMLASHKDAVVQYNAGAATLQADFDSLFSKHMHNCAMVSEVIELIRLLHYDIEYVERQIAEFESGVHDIETLLTLLRGRLRQTSVHQNQIRGSADRIADAADVAAGYSAQIAEREATLAIRLAVAAAERAETEFRGTLVEYIADPEALDYVVGRTNLIFAVQALDIDAFPKNRRKAIAAAQREALELLNEAPNQFSADQVLAASGGSSAVQRMRSAIPVVIGVYVLDKASERLLDRGLDELPGVGGGACLIDAIIEETTDVGYDYLRDALLTDPEIRKEQSEWERLQHAIEQNFDDLLERYNKCVEREEQRQCELFEYLKNRDSSSGRSESGYDSCGPRDRGRTERSSDSPGTESGGGSSGGSGGGGSGGAGGGSGGGSNGGGGSGGCDSNNDGRCDPGSLVG